MEQKKKTSWVFKCTVITILLVLGVYLLREVRYNRSFLFGNTQANENVTPSRILKQAVHRIERLKSISAKIDLTVILGKSELRGTGTYEELSLKAHPSDQSHLQECFGRTSLFRLQLILRNTQNKITGSQEQNKLTIVCDKESLWILSSIEGEQTLKELQLEKMADILTESVQLPSDKNNPERSGIQIPSPITSFPGLGGMSGLLQHLSTLYDFEDNVDIVSPDKKDPSIRTWRIRGILKKDVWEKNSHALCGEKLSERESLLKLIPNGIEIYIGQKDYLPYRLCYYSFDMKKPKNRSELVNLDFTDIYENHDSVKPEDFTYNPGEIAEDITNSYLEKIIPEINN